MNRPTDDPKTELVQSLDRPYQGHRRVAQTAARPVAEPIGSGTTIDDDQVAAKAKGQVEVRQTMGCRNRLMVTAAATALALAVASSAGSAKVHSDPVASAISKLLATDPSDPMNGIAHENDEDERYHHSITVEFTGQYGDSVETQVRMTAEIALRVGYLVLQEGLKPPGPDLIIKMALKKPDTWFINTFSVRYRWADVLAAAKADARIADLAAKGTIERIWPEYWSTMCLNPPPVELFGQSLDANPEMPEDVENPKGKDLSCHRKR